MADANLLERARSALGRALRLTHALGEELSQPSQPAGTVGSQIPYSPSANSNTGTETPPGCMGFDRPEGRLPSPAMPHKVTSQHSDRLATPVSAANSSGVDSDCLPESNERWWEQRDGSSTSSSDCFLLRPSPTADAVHSSTIPADVLHGGCGSEEQCSDSQIGQPSTPDAAACPLHEQCWHPHQQIDRSHQHTDTCSLGCIAATSQPQADQSHTASSNPESQYAAHGKGLLGPDTAACNGSSRPVDQIAERLGAVQRQQADTVSQLLQLRQVSLPPFHRHDNHDNMGEEHGCMGREACDTSQSPENPRKHVWLNQQLVQQLG